VVAIDLPTSNYADAREFPVIDYDGRTIPFPDQSFDVVFSSNVLEHVCDLDVLHAETQRVLKPGGVCIHVLPTDAWRFWTTISAFPAAPQYLWQLAPDLLPRRVGRSELIRLARTALHAIALATLPFRQRRHGERGNILTEQLYFRPEWWRRNFRAHGFEIVDDAPMGLFYTGHMVLPSLSFVRRRQLARTLGSACHLFELRPVQGARVQLVSAEAESA
jgi:SAM-dependent methyltransferase